jgi:four helix bundle protein
MLKKFLPLLFVLGLVHAEDFTFDSAGVKLHYTVEGTGEPVILIHGYAASAVANFGAPGITKGLASSYRVIVLAVYKYTANFPKTETYGLTSQFRRVAASIPANIAEGFRRRGRADKARFLNIGQASLEECRYYLILSKDLGYGSCEELVVMLEETSKVLNSYAKAILNSNS